MKAKSPEERKAFVRLARLCDNCFRRGHVAKDCRCNMKCPVSGCGWKHHSMLHQIHKNNTESRPASDNPLVTSPEPGASEVSGASETGQCGATGATGAGKKVCLKVDPGMVRGGGQDEEFKINALLDPASDVALCDINLVKKLGLKGQPKEFSLATVNGSSEIQRGQEVSLMIKGVNSHEVFELENVWTADTLRLPKGSAPSHKDVEDWPRLTGIDLPQIESDEIMLLIGSDVPEAHWVYDQRRGKRGQPYVVRTPLGWTLMGPVNSCANDSFSVNFIRYDNEMLHRQMERMFRAEFNEPFTSAKIAMSVEDRRALSQMESSAKPVTLPNNQGFTMKRLSYLKKRLLRDPLLFCKYKDTIHNYLSRRIPQDELMPGPETPIWYLPHHPVFHPQKPGKARVVFDCAAEFEGTSLNEQLLQGPDLTNSLVGILTCFRQEPVAMVADIEGMFHQVHVTPQDCHSLRFLWWPNDDPTEEPVDYQMLVHLFGVTSSPSCASFSLKKTTSDNESEFDVETINTVNRNFYVDNCLKSVPTTEKAMRLSGELRALLRKGGFRLTKWISNDRNVLATVPEDCVPSVVNLHLEDLPMERTLGVQWNMETDDFKFRVIDKGKNPTRRGILSVVSSMYDPLGFVTPIIFPAKSSL